MGLSKNIQHIHFMMVNHICPRLNFHTLGLGHTPILKQPPGWQHQGIDVQEHMRISRSSSNLEKGSYKALARILQHLYTKVFWKNIFKQL